MREQLIHYVSLLFAGARNAEEIQQEILQNTLDRYDDMIAQGKSPEAAYRLAISGIGDINEILGTLPNQDSSNYAAQPQASKENSSVSKILKALAVGLYILSPLPLFLLDEMNMSTLGLCGTLSLIAIATVLIILGKKKDSPVSEAPTQNEPPENELTKSINSLIWAIGLAVYFIVSFSTQAWFITWVIFPMIGAVQGIAKACMDLKEG